MLPQHFQSHLGIVVFVIVGLILTACSSMEARLSLAPFTKDKQKRDAIELIAENYCRRKRSYPGASGIKRQPDFIFTTDGCSRAPDDHWVACCIVHDISYWCGGSQADRNEADRFLKQCVSKQHPITGSLFFAVVRLGGTPWLPTPWRWGYGWQGWPHGYESLWHSPPVIKLFNDLNIKSVVQEQLQK